MSKLIAIIIGLVLVVALVLFSMTFTVNYHEIAIKTRFGETGPDSVIETPGLKFRLPLHIDTVTKIDKRLQLRDSTPETIQTSDGQQVVVRAFMMWRVQPTREGALRFFGNYPGGVGEANSAISDQFITAMRIGLSRYSFNDLIGAQSRLKDAEQAIMNEMATVQGKGIEPVSIGISQLMLPPKTTTAVLERMATTRNTMAKEEQARGLALTQSIQSRAAADADKITTFANQRAAEIKALGNKNAEVYLAKMNEEPGLAIFLTWLDSLEVSLSRYTTLVMPTSFSPLHLLDPDGKVDAKAIPVPASDLDMPGQRQGGVAGAAPVIEQPAQAPKTSASGVASDDAQQGS